MPPKVAVTRVLNFYLIKKGFEHDDEIVPEAANLSRYAIALQVGCKGTLYLKPSRPALPRWIELFAGQIDLNKTKVISSGSSAVLLVRRAGRIFALSFGYGRTLLNKEAIEERFGLRVTLNSIDAERIRTIDRKSLDAVPRIMREQSSKEGAVESFSVNTENDLIRSFSGIPADESLGSRIAGSDSLSVTIRAGLGDIPAMLDSYISKWNDKSYLKYFPWIDHIEEIKNPSQLTDLDAELIHRVKTGNLDKLWLAVPELLDWSSFGGFRYQDAKKGEIYNDIHFNSFLGTVRDLNQVDSQYLRHRNVYCFDTTAELATDKWSVYRCINAEIEKDHKTYLLSDGKWYCIDPSFVRRVDKELSQIPATGVQFPKFADSSEYQYNRRVCKGSKKVLALMDSELIPYGGGQSRIEFCDMYSQDRIMYHVKRYGGSSVLSHLFLQGEHSASLLLFDQDFRTEINKKLPVTHRLESPRNRPNPGDYEVAYIVLSQSTKKLTLPFFSRLTLRNTYRRLMGYGYRVTLTKVESNKN